MIKTEEAITATTNMSTLLGRQQTISEEEEDVEGMVMFGGTATKIRNDETVLHPGNEEEEEVSMVIANQTFNCF